MTSGVNCVFLVPAELYWLSWLGGVGFNLGSGALSPVRLESGGMMQAKFVAAITTPEDKSRRNRGLLMLLLH